MFLSTYRSPAATLYSRALARATWDDSDLTVAPRIDVRETDQAYIVTADLPGVDKQAIDLKIEGKRVTLQAPVSQAQKQTQDGVVVEEPTLIYSERHTAKYARSFVLPQPVEQDSAQAVYENGVLKLTLPKQATAQAKRINVQ